MWGSPKRTNVGLDRVSIVPLIGLKYRRHILSNKIPIRDSGSCVSKASVNPHEIVGIRLNDTSKQGLMHEQVSKRVKMQRSKESQTGGTKQARQALHHTE